MVEVLTPNRGNLITLKLHVRNRKGGVGLFAILPTHRKGNISRISLIRHKQIISDEDVLLAGMNSNVRKPIPSGSGTYRICWRLPAATRQTYFYMLPPDTLYPGTRSTAF